jgi:ParB-like chromosome segregation protein Spo0J
LKLKQLKKIAIKDIVVLNKRRPLVEKKLPVITDSMGKIGLQTPITVREGKRGFVLVTGLHRLEAAKSLGWTHIDCFIVTGDNTNLWKEAENLHRAGLTALQRAQAVQRWERLIKQREAGEDETPKGGRQPSDKRLSKTAKQLGTSREAIRRSRAVASLSRKIQKVAKATGLDDNEAALLKVAKEPTPGAQAKKVRELAKRMRTGAHSLSQEEVKQLKALKRTFAQALKFKKAWNNASADVRQKFIKTVLKPNSQPPKEPDKDTW